MVPELVTSESVEDEPVDAGDFLFGWLGPKQHQVMSDLAGKFHLTDVFTVKKADRAVVPYGAIGMSMVS